MRNADALVICMKQQIDQLIADDQALQHYLKWVSEKSQSVDASYKPAAVRAFYFDLNCDYHYENIFDIPPDCIIGLDCAIDRALEWAFNLVRSFDCDFNSNFAIYYNRAIVLSSACTIDSALSHACEIALASGEEHTLQGKLRELTNQLPEPSEGNWRQFRVWWQANGEGWRHELRTVMIQHRNIGHDWQFSDKQRELLRQYYNANQLLVDCLNSDCYVSREVRQEIEDTLLLPIAEITARNSASKCSEQTKLGYDGPRKLDR